MRNAVLDIPGLQALVDELRGRGRTVVAPTVRDSAIVLAEVRAITELPQGIGDEQAPGGYRVVDRGGEALFGFAAPAQSAKPWLFPADELVWRGTRSQPGAEQPSQAERPSQAEQPSQAEGLSRGTGEQERANRGHLEPGHGEPTQAPPRIEPAIEPARVPLALLGVRGCDLAAIGIHDTVLLGRAAVDVRYAARRADAFLIAVTCANPAGTCFCDSMGTGPKPGPGADLVLTELLDDGPHRFLVEAGTPAGEEVLAAVPTAPTTEADEAAAQNVVATAVDHMGRHLDTTDLRDLLYASAKSPRWNDVAERCLSCTNCTMVCPTCFCTDIADVSDLTGAIDERHRVWDSCFSMEYSRLHGGAVRKSASSRYRQWLTHKLGSWNDQFGMSGCVGCGRCITWCPVGIDITAEAAALRADAAKP